MRQASVTNSDHFGQSKACKLIVCTGNALSRKGTILLAEGYNIYIQMLYTSHAHVHSVSSGDSVNSLRT